MVERAMRQEGFVSAAVACAQYDITRAQLLEVVLQGKIRPQKPESGALFYVNWSDCLAYFSTPAEFRARPKKTAVTTIAPDEPEIILDGMIPPTELDELYRRQADEKAAQRAAAKAARESQAGGAPQQRVVVRPAQ